MFEEFLKHDNYFVVCHKICSEQGRTVTKTQNPHKKLVNLVQFSAFPQGIPMGSVFMG
jgi:hypothetical protein